MKKNLPRWIIGLCGAAAAVLLSSCMYDPYYSSYGYSDSYYGGGGFSTSVFVSTGNSRWGYDPYCHSYYDYHRRAYYDPYLYGYYPVGYRPPIIIGVPHPGGWRPGYGHCPPPRRVVDHRISDYRNRESLYRRSDFSWSNQVRQREAGRSVNTDNIRRVDANRDRSELIRNSQGGGRDRSPGNVIRPTDRGPGSNFGRPTERPSTDWNRDRGNDRGPMVRPDRTDSNRFTPQRRDIERTPSQRPTFNSPDRSRGRSSPGYSPSGFNNPVGIRPDRRPEPSVRPQMPERSAPPQMRERPSPEIRQAPPSGFSRPERSSGGGRPSHGGGGGEGRRSR